MAGFRLPRRVEARIAAILDEGAARFGDLARDRYAAIIVQAMRDVAENPRRHGARREPAVDPDALFYHLRHSSRRAADPHGRVATPRHILVYEVAADGVVDILGLIPDRMPPEIALPRFIPGR